MMRYLKHKFGEHSTIAGTILSLAVLIGSFFVPAERADIANVMQALAVPLFAGFFFWKDEK
jgi:hypothetical protein